MCCVRPRFQGGRPLSRDLGPEAEVFRGGSSLAARGRRRRCGSFQLSPRVAVGGGPARRVGRIPWEPRLLPAEALGLRSSGRRREALGLSMRCPSFLDLGPGREVGAARTSDAGSRTTRQRWRHRERTQVPGRFSGLRQGVDSSVGNAGWSHAECARSRSRRGSPRRVGGRCTRYAPIMQESVCGWRHLRVFGCRPDSVHATLVGKWSGVSLNASQGHERTVAVRPFAATSPRLEYRGDRELALQGHGGCAQPIRH